MRRMTEKQYVSLKKKAGSQVSGSFPFMNVLRSDVPSASLGSVARPPPSTKRGRREEGGSGVPPRDGDGGNGGAEGGRRELAIGLSVLFPFWHTCASSLYSHF